MAGVLFTPNPTTCTSNCSYIANVVWNSGPNKRTCGVALTAVPDTSVPSKTTLPTDIFPTGAPPGGGRRAAGSFRRGTGLVKISDVDVRVLKRIGAFGFAALWTPLRDRFRVDHRRKIAPELFAHAVCKAVALGAKIVGNARPLPQFNDDGIGDGKRSEATQIGAQGRGHHLGVTAVVLGTGRVKRSRKRSICFGLMA